ncbi:MAG: beta-hydroxyacyl-ACP dehydratase [Bacteriovoracaceae bacterium]|nr:beta-hydroxyacyl-ACP dehydratase [Bacteriovoracaceae bacterium]
MNPIERIPQKDPFLFIDELVERSEDSIHTRKLVKESEDYFKGHFPGNPIMPGVLICEACFQSGALLMSYKDDGISGKTAVVSRIQSAKFKQMVKPGDMLDIKVELKELISPAAYMKAVASVDGKKALIIEFAVTLVENA